MIIKSLKICNFKNFEGEHIVDFTTNRAKRCNIVLIGGPNGAGKTSLLDAIKICFFGKHVDNISNADSDYKKYILSCKNTASTKNGDSRFYLKLEIEVEDSYPKYDLVLERKWKIEKGEPIESFSIVHNNKSFEFIPKEFWQEYVETIIPPYIASYFFFDSQKVKDFATGNDACRILKESISDIVGLNLHKTLSQDLRKLTRKIKRRSIGDEGLEDILHKREKEITKHRKHYETTLKEMSQNRQNREELKAELETTGKELKRTSGAFAQNRKKREDELLHLRQKVHIFENEIVDVCGEVLPFIIASDLCDNLLRTLRKELRLKSMVARRDVFIEVRTRVMNTIGRKRDLKKRYKKNIKHIKSNIADIFEKIEDEFYNDKKINILHDMTASEVNIVENILNNEEKQLEKRLNDLLKRREDSQMAIKKIERELKRIPDDHYVTVFVERIAKLRTKMSLYDEEYSKMEEKAQSLKEQIEDINIQIGSVEDKIVCSTDDTRKIDIASKLQSVIADYIRIIVPTKINELEKVITTMYRSLVNKDDMVKEVKLNRENIDAELLGYDGNIVNKKYISEGEKEIFALSILWGLAQISHKKIPVIIDSPLEKLDNTHVNNIVSEFLTNAAHQVIILAHDKEFSIDAYRKLKKKVCKEYVLSLNNKNKIREAPVI